MELIFKCVDFLSEIPLIWWNLLIKISSFLIEISIEFKGPICAKYEKHLPIDNFDLIVNYYKVLWFGVDHIGLEDLKKHKKDLFIKHLIRGEEIPKKVIKTLFTLIKEDRIPNCVLFGFIYEFLSSDSGDKNIFIVQLSCCALLIGARKTSLSSLLTAELVKRTFQLAKSCHWNLLYRNLFLLTEIEILPEKVEVIFNLINKGCNFDSFNFELSNRNDADVHSTLATVYDATADFFCFGSSFDKVNLNVKPFLSFSEIKPLNCLTQLLKLLSLKIDDSKNHLLFEYIWTIKKRHGNSDEYFNLLFPS